MGVGGDSAVQSHSMGGVRGRAEGHTGTHTGTYTRMLHLPFSDLPLKKCPFPTTIAAKIVTQKNSLQNQPAPKYHTKGCSHSSADSLGARTLVFTAF